MAIDPLYANDEDIFQEIYAICKEAYEDGVDSAEIYEVLHDPSVIKGSCRTSSKFHPVEWLVSSSIKLFHLVLSRNSLNVSHKLIVRVVLFGLLLVTGVFVGAANCFTDFTLVNWFPILAERSCLLPAHQLILEMVRPIQNCSMCADLNEGSSVVVEFHRPPTEEEFFQYAYSSKPLVVRKAGHECHNGSCVEKTAFSFADLKRIFESEPGGVDSVSEECQFLPFRSPFVSLRNAFDSISDNAEWDQPWYIGWSNCHPGVAAKLREMFPRPRFLPSDSELSAIDWIFIGSPGLGAAMHIDYVRRPSWQTQLSGTKKWILRPPPECEALCQDSVDITIYPGDMIFVDTNVWFHETRIEGNQLAISIGSEYD